MLDDKVQNADGCRRIVHLEKWKKHREMLSGISRFHWKNIQLKYIYDKHGVNVRFVISRKWGPGAVFTQTVAKLMVP